MRWAGGGQDEVGGARGSLEKILKFDLSGQRSFSFSLLQIAHVSHVLHSCEGG